MLHDEEFLSGVDDKYKKLKGRRIRVELSLAEIELIRSAFAAYEESHIITTLNELAAGLSMHGLSETDPQHIRDEIESAFANSRRHEEMLELLRARFVDAMDTELANDKAQEKLNFGMN